MKKKIICFIILLAIGIVSACAAVSDDSSKNPVKGESIINEQINEIATDPDNEEEEKNVDEISGDSEVTQVNLYILSGPTGIGAVNLWDCSERGTTENHYQITLVGANDEIVAAISNGDADIAAVATNLASTLYNKTNGGVTVLAVNTTGVLSILSNGDTCTSISELKGKTIYSPGQGANPEYILRYLLNGNGIDFETDLDVRFVSEGSELLQVWSKEPDALILAPQPVATVLKIQNENAKTVCNLSDEWEKCATDGSALLMGCVIVRTEFMNQNPGAVLKFMSEYENSILSAQSDIDTTAELCEKYGIIAKAAVAKKAIPYCGLTFLTGEAMKTQLSGYLQVMYAANPASVGGQLPSDDFYYKEQ